MAAPLPATGVSSIARAPVDPSGAEAGRANQEGQVAVEWRGRMIKRASTGSAIAGGSLMIFLLIIGYAIDSDPVKTTAGICSIVGLVGLLTRLHCTGNNSDADIPID